MTSRKTMSYAGALASAVALALAGCNGGDKEATASPTPSSSGSSATSSPSGSGSASASATPSPTSTVRIPSKAQAKTEEGAIEFAKFYVLEMNRADVSSDSSVFRALSDSSCSSCSEIADIVDQNKAAGTRLDKVTMTVNDASVLDDSGDGYTIGLLVDEAPSQRLDRQGKVISKNPAGRLNIELGLKRSGDGWSVQALEIK
ncbi:DUF6318 family protein [Knoellia remsis]|nr:DUF6318 family protein [Knoellia remsis]